VLPTVVGPEGKADNFEVLSERTSSRPRRVLQIIRAMNRGGAEIWLMHLLRRLDPERVRMDFLVHTAEPCAFDDEILGRKAGLIRCLESWKTPVYGQRICSLLRRFGPYDAVHSHVHHFSGYLLMLARRAGVPVRISHSHNDTSVVDGGSSAVRRCYLRWMTSRIRAHATHMVAVSSPAGRALFGPGWERDPRARTFSCGIDLAPIDSRRPRLAARSALGIADDELVIGHVGRFEEQKNHRFLIEVAAALMQQRARTRLLLVGDGPLRSQMQRQIRTLGIAANVILAGQRPDVPDLLSAMDVFVFPSLYEGLGMALVEAQACGLPCVVSDAVPEEADAVPGLIHRMTIQESVEAWAKVVTSAVEMPRPNLSSSFAMVEKSRLNLANSMNEVYALYQDGPGNDAAHWCSVK